jgi:hypothetical protein
MTRAARLNSRAPASAPHLPWFDHVLYYVLLATLAVRPLICESYEPVQVPLLTALQATGGPTPAATAAMDTLLLAAGGLALARSRRCLASPLVALGIILLAAAVIVSSRAAGDKHLALLAGSSLVIGVLGGAALASLLQARWMLHTLLAALLATGCTTAIKCANQYVFESRQMREQWESVYKPELLRQGFDPQDPLFVNFERRMMAGESYGFLGHPNITGSCLAMWLLVAGGLLVGVIILVFRVAAAGWTDRSARILPVALLAAYFAVVGLAAGLCLTRSLGAVMAALVGVIMLTFLGLTAGWAARHARTLVAALLAGYLAVIGLAAGYGLSKGTLPHPSLAFRWYYWTAAARASQDVPLIGLGRENFGTAYTLYKPARSTEEVRNPHNVWVSLLVELGPLGLVGGLLLAVLSMLAGLRSLRPSVPLRTPQEEPTIGYAAPLAVAVLLLHAWFSGTPFSQLGMGLVWAQEIALPWTLAFLLIIWITRDLEATPGRATWLAAGLCAGLAASLVHGLLDFALLTPGGLSLFVLCAAATVGLRGGSAPSTRGRWRHHLPAGAAVVLAAAHLYWVSLPTARAATAMQRLETALHTPPPKGGPGTVLAAADRAAHSGDPSAARLAARTVVQLSRLPKVDGATRRQWLGLARSYAEAAVRHNPRDSSNYALLAMVEQELATSLGSAASPDQAWPAWVRHAWVWERHAWERHAWERAAASWDDAVRRYPTDPRTRISAGRAWLELWRLSGRPQAADRAREHFEQALRIDDQRPPQDTVRLRPKERDQVAGYLRQLATAVLSPAPAP